MTAGKKQRLQLLSTTEAGARLGTSREQIRRLIAQGELSSIDVHATGTRAKTRVYEHEIDAFIERRTTRTA